MIFLLLASSFLLINAQDAADTCNLSACHPQNVLTAKCYGEEGELIAGEKCYASSMGLIYCCLPENRTTSVVTTVTTDKPTTITTSTPTTTPTTTTPTTTTTTTTLPTTTTKTRRTTTTTRWIPPTEPPRPCYDLTETCNNERHLCFDPQYKATMREKCHYTCGYCNNCQDSPKMAGLSGCRCDGNIDLTLELCARSCGYCGGLPESQSQPVVPTPAPPPAPAPSCPPGTINVGGRCQWPRPPSQPRTHCVDKVNPQTGISDCTQKAYLCNDRTYIKLMTEQCPVTCNRCPGGQGSGGPTHSQGCVDRVHPATGISDCPHKVNFCNNSAYRQLMRTECPRTCGYC